jgi:prefoldin subunit 5
MIDARPTPETDAIQSLLIGSRDDILVALSRIRKLERERDEAREAKLGLCGLSTKETWRKVCEANALRAHIDELQTLLPDDATIKHGVERLKRERDELAKWKDEQMFVESQWNAQAVAKELGMIVGSDIRKNILPAIRQLKRERDAMLEAIREAHDAIASIHHPLGDETGSSGNPCVGPNPTQGRALAAALAQLKHFLS